MEQTKIDRYVENLDVEGKNQLLKKTINLLLNWTENTMILGEDKDFITNQINEFDEQFRMR